jgi:hypothetical protein
LLGIERLAVRVRFDLDRRPQRTALADVHAHARDLLCEVPNPLKARVPFSHRNRTLPTNRARSYRGR